MTTHDTGIPVLSLADFDGRKGDFSDRLGEAWREFGFVGITDHGIDQQVIDDAYDAFREFFALPEETKLQYHHPGKGGARGYTGFGVEHAKGREVPDLKEFWHVGRELEPENNPHPDILLPNVWPEEVPNFRERALAVYNALESVGASLTRTRVGDGYVADRLRDEGVVFGGEPSGAWIWPEETLCPDGPLAACRLAALVARRGPLAELAREIETYPIRRENVETEAKEDVMERVRELVAGRYDDVATLDGVRVDRENGWFLVRASGTQPLIRVTAEARDPEEADAVLEEALGVVSDAGA